MAEQIESPKKNDKYFLSEEYWKNESWRQGDFYTKSTVAPVVFQRVFAYHLSQYSHYSAIYTDGSKRCRYVGCGVVIEDIMHGYRLDTSCSIFTAEAVAIYRALQLIDSTMPRKYCIYTDIMSVLEALENYHDRCHPVVCTILDITSRLYSKGFDIVFCWLPSHVGIIGNEQADSAAKSATTHLPLAVPLSDMKRVILHHIFQIWQESWSQQLDNKLHSVKPVIGAWPVMPMRRTDVKLTRLRIGHTRFTHRHLLFGERAPECPSCHVSYTVHHILIDCPVFNNYRITFFNSSHLTLPDLAELVPSTSSVTVASPSKSPPPNSVIDTAPTTSNSLSISAASSSSTACSVFEPTTTISHTIPATSQDANQTSKPRRKKRPPKNQSNSIKPKIEIKSAPHRPHKSGPTEYTTDEEDMIIYDVEDEPEPNPQYVLNMNGFTYKGEMVHKPNHSFIKYDFANPIKKPF
ncbi:RNase H domain-containing protein [Trichonephila clavipes]|nr:RNase H domain-containing protein [Trichonephila clavipes]